MSAHRHRMRGVSMVEFALMAPLILMLMYLVFEMGRAGYDNTVMASAAREGARTAVAAQEAGNSSAGLDADIIAAVGRSLGGGILLDTSKVYDIADTSHCKPVAALARICRSPAPGTMAGGSVNNGQISVEVVYGFQPYAGDVRRLVGSSISLKSITTMKTEY